VHASISPASQRFTQPFVSASEHARAAARSSGGAFGPSGGGSGGAFIPCFSASAQPAQRGSRFFPARRRMRNSTRRFLARAASSLPLESGQYAL
jgi:hypothetical protein